MASGLGRLTSLSATHPRPGGWSRYVGMGPDQVHESYTHGVRRIQVVSIAVIVLAALLCLGPGLHVDWTLPAYFVVLAIDMMAVVVLSSRHLQGLVDISNRDCDPQLLGEVASRLLSESKSGRASNGLALVQAVCNHNLGHDDVALQWLDKVSLRRVPSRIETTMLSVRAATALNRGDVPQARELRDQLAACSARGAAERERLRAVAILDARLALAEGDVALACERLSQAASPENLPIQEVSVEYVAAQVEEASGDLDAARERMELVAANAGTLVIGERAQAWLAEHGLAQPGLG